MTAASAVGAVPAVRIAAAIATRTEVTELVAQLRVERLLERDADDVTATGPRCGLGRGDRGTDRGRNLVVVSRGGTAGR